MEDGENNPLTSEEFRQLVAELKERRTSEYEDMKAMLQMAGGIAVDLTLSKEAFLKLAALAFSSDWFEGM